MNILVIGGSYFLGKCFVNMAKEQHSLTLINRGNTPLNLEGVTEIKGDRHCEDDIKNLSRNHYDVIVDFCGYSAGDIGFLLKNLNMKISQYIFISTVDVYEHGLSRELKEDAPYEERNFGGPEGDYILGKVSLEKELIECSLKYGFKYTIIRPSFIYGPDNYAPREGIYFHWIKTAHQVIHPEDATGEFQFVYVKDVAKAILKAIGNASAYDEAFSLASPEIMTYESFMDVLTKVFKEPFELISVDVNTVLEKGIPLPFPLTKEESNWYNGTKALALIESYESMEEGLLETIEYQQIQGEQI